MLNPDVHCATVPGMFCETKEKTNIAFVNTEGKKPLKTLSYKNNCGSEDMRTEVIPLFLSCLGTFQTKADSTSHLQSGTGMLVQAVLRRGGFSFRAALTLSRICGCAPLWMKPFPIH